ncbi:MAG: transglutaminase domain-containing protein, partial [Chitinophagaceae bacterium]
LTDTRIKRFAFYHKIYPYTVVFEDEQEFDGIYFLPNWQPLDDQRISVQQSSFIVTTPADYQLRYLQNAYPGKPIVKQEADKMQHLWQIANRKAMLKEPFQPDFMEIVPTVYVAPTSFEIDGYKGDMSSWESFGSFVGLLNKGRDILPDDIKRKVKEIANQYSTTQDKVTALYEFLQKNTRYISIQLGVGSWQPFDAKYVVEKKYGDCKALSNYMQAILKEVGIEAHYALIQAGWGRKGIYENFPSPYFNHAVVCVPNGQDSIWLECTSQTVSAGYAGKHTGDRKALLITPNGGVVANTPKYTAKENVQIRKVVASIQPDGTLLAEVKTRFTGIQQELAHNLHNDATPEQRQQYLNSVLSLPTYKVEEIKYQEEKGIVPAMNEYLKIQAPAYASVSGKRLFVVPNLFNKEGKLQADDDRQYDVFFRSSFKDVDTIEIKIPDGYLLESAPKSVVAQSKYGSYRISYQYSGNTIQLIREQLQEKGVYPPSEYSNIVKYFDDLYKADRGKMIFVKKE